MYKKLPRRDVVKSIFDYKDGELFWKKRTSNRVHLGDIAGSINKYGYKTTSLFNSEYYIHRLIWVWHYGSIPRNKQIDHIDHNPLNNCIGNLRLTSDAENKLNLPMRKTNKSGHRGVHWDSRRNKWFAQIQRNNKTTALGRFEHIEDAIKARRHAEEHMG